MGGQHTLCPILDVLDILVRVIEVLLHEVLVRVEEARFWSSALLDGHAPRTVLDTSSDVTGKGILCHISHCRGREWFNTYRVGGGKIHVVGTSRAVEGVEWVHSLDLSCVCIHTTGGLTGLDVAPNHGSHIPLVVHETSIKVWSIVGIGRDDVG